VRLATGAGFRNLVGEEVFARLGAQSIALYFLRQLRGGAGLAIVASSLYFEIWHNPFELPQFLNFAASCVLGWAYHKHGYEVAAVGHCVADWLALGVLPSLLFG
jgi:membrane protease YdiL (CAAX protease family)